MRDVVELIFPPGIPAIARWRLAMAACMGMLFLHAGWASGLMTRLGIGSGFAVADDLKEIGDQVGDIKLQLLEQDIFNARLHQCTAVKESNREARQYWTQRLAELLQDYIKRTGVQYQLPTCEEL